MALQRWLGGREITGGLPALVGDRVEKVDAHGKHLMMRFASGRMLHTHMRMTGSWHVYQRGARWKAPAWQARVVVECGDRIAVCFNAPVVELMSQRDAALHPALSALGPDVLADDLDVAGIVSRAALLPGTTEIGDLLLDQTVLSGVGNIWRCESLFACRVHPRQTVDGVDLPPLIEAAARLMRTGGAHFVYGRTRRPCRRCGSLIVSARVGVQGRTAYWCPTCQALSI